MDPQTKRYYRYHELLMQYRRQMENYCIGHSNNLADGQDMLQEVMVAVWNGIEGLHEESSPRQVNRWLQKVMRTVYVRHKRKQRCEEPMEVMVERRVGRRPRVVGRPAGTPQRRRAGFDAGAFAGLQQSGDCAVPWSSTQHSGATDAQNH